MTFTKQELKDMIEAICVAHEAIIDDEPLLQRLEDILDKITTELHS